MPIDLRISADSVEEFDGLLARFHPGAGRVATREWGDTFSVTKEAPKAEAEAPLSDAAPKQTRQRRSAPTTSEPAQEASETTAAGSPESTSGQSEEHPLLVPKTLADVKALGNKLVSELGAAPVQSLLMDKFKVKAFGALDAADYDSAYAALEALK